MNRKLILNIGIILLSAHICFAQGEKKNSIYLEAGGNAIAYSVNYDRIFTLAEGLKFAPRIGFEYYPHRASSAYNDVVIPIEANILFAKSGNSKNYLEAGAGLSLIGMKETFISQDAIQNRNKFARVTLIRLGFRHQKPIGGLMYRIGLLAPVFQDSFSKKVVGDDIFSRLYAGIGIGHTF